jgi:predicted nucleic acid-binding protein
MKPLFLDTGYVVALEAADDQHHATVALHWKDLLAALPPLVTTMHVFSEIVTFFNCRRQHNKAVEVGTRLLDSPSVEIVQVDDELLREGWEYLVRHQDKTYSMTDCISFILMRRRGIPTALTTDKHFEQAGFQRIPQA